MISLSMFQLFAAAGDTCKVAGGSFLGFPHWYKYLSGVRDANNFCSPQITNINDVWLIVAAGIEIMLRVVVLVAIGFIVYGGAQYILSQAEPEKTNKARHTILDALIGLVIAVAATAAVTFVAGRFRY